MVSGSTVFWSYAHEDDSADHGRIRELAKDLQEEYSLLSGNKLELFVDRASIEWGDQWKARIDDALVSSTFFIPILSNRYFTRSECTREMLSFFAQAKSRGLEKMMLPLVYVKLNDFTPENPNENIALAARTQYFDWTLLRLKDSKSHEYREAVNALAVRLIELGIETRAIERITDAREKPEGRPDSGLVDHLENISALLPDWLKAVEDDVVTLAKYKAIDAVYADRLRKIMKMPGNTKLRLATIHRFATDEMPLAKELLAAARIYSALTIKLHPPITGALREISDSPAFLSTLTELRTALQVAVDQVNANTPPPGAKLSNYLWGEVQHLGSIFREIYDVDGESVRLRIETNEIVFEWYSALEELFKRVGV